MRAAVFDLDGTLADTSADLLAAANRTLAEAGSAARLDPARHRATAFAGGRAMLRAGLGEHGAVDEAEVDRLYPRLLAHYADALAVETQLYDGVAAALDRLEAQGWALGICTNKPEGLAVDLIDALGLGARFAVLLGADSLPWRKPDPRHLLETISRLGGVPGRAVLVGDTVTDRDAARAAGVPCVLVGFGPDGEAAAALEPAALVAHYDELPELLERLVPA
ncbi:MAG TPA: HAD-IA family hydrolase [Amaricoccus sp.]|nr:HAD-IA family hydrolase [Amaricoccus sp.]